MRPTHCRTIYIRSGFGYNIDENDLLRLALLSFLLRLSVLRNNTSTSLKVCVCREANLIRP